MLFDYRNGYQLRGEGDCMTDEKYKRHLRAHRPRYDAMLEYIDLQKAESVVDVGVEPYLFAKLLAESSPDDVSLYGIAYGEVGSGWTKDISDRSMDVRCCNVEQDQWPFDDDAVDRVVFGAIIEHLFDPLFALKEARRILSSDGVLVLSTPNAVRLSVRLKTVLGMNPYDGFPLESKYNRHNHEWTLDELEDILSVAGFNVENKCFVKINRTGLKQMANIGHRIHPSLADQIVLQCSIGTSENRNPVTYRTGLTEDDSHS